MVSNRHVLSQGPALKALGRVALLATAQRLGGLKGALPELPGSMIRGEVAPLPPALIKAYIGHVGGDARAYQGVLPPHLFPQWGFGLAARTLEGLPYPLMGVVNGGCRLEIKAPLPADQPLEVSAQLVGVDDNGSRAILHQVVTTGPREVPDALIAHMTPIVVTRRDKGKGKEKRARASVPLDATEVAFWRIGASAGLDFARLTGDFNPIHWIPAYARASGFKSTILHGFATMARAIEGLNKGLYAGSPALTGFDVRFTRPLTLPGNVGLYIRRQEGGGEVWVGDAPGGEVYMSGTYETPARETPS